MKKLLLISILSISFGGLTLACSMDGKEGFVPENDLALRGDDIGTLRKAVQDCTQGCIVSFQIIQCNFLFHTGVPL